MAAVTCSVLVLLLPILMAALSLAEPATDGERARLERMLAGRPPAARVDAPLSNWFHTIAVRDASWPPAAREQQSLVVRARVAQVLGVAALALLTYFVVLLGRGRLAALLAVGFVALLPPIASGGHVLRVETPTAVFALLSLLLLQVAASATPRMRQRRPLRRSLVGGTLMLWAALAAAVAIASLPSHGLPLLLPGVVLLVGAMLFGWRGVRCLRRRGLLGTPVRAINRRLLPWTATALVAPAIALLLLRATLTVSVDELAATSPASTLLPAGAVAFASCSILLWGGVVAAVARVGLRLNRGARIDPELLLFVFAAAALVAWAVGAGGHDPLVLLPGIAVMFAEGAQALLVLASGLLPRGSAAVTSPPGR